MFIICCESYVTFYLVLKTSISGLFRIVFILWRVILLERFNVDTLYKQLLSRHSIPGLISYGQP